MPRAPTLGLGVAVVVGCGVGVCVVVVACCVCLGCVVGCVCVGVVFLSRFISEMPLGSPVGTSFESPPGLSVNVVGPPLQRATGVSRSASRYGASISFRAPGQSVPPCRSFLFVLFIFFDFWLPLKFSISLLLLLLLLM